ncbi:MAG TPA: class I SAM-dependent methyltransferase [Candidatus Angelobacter sp.]|nr:class I SAM-dependent methyltransferase [Candidatus Angelobacter sp.]
MKIDKNLLAQIRGYLDEMMYSLVDLRMSFELAPSPTGFPRFQQLQQIIQRLDLPHQVLFRLFRLGDAVQAASVRSIVPGKILESMLAAGLLKNTEQGELRTPSLLIVPIDSLLLFVGIPQSYPTATRPCNTWFDLSSYVVARALPGRLAQHRVLDVCSGSGLQSLLCAARGARTVVGLELNEEAVLTAQANAVFNDFETNVEFRQSDKLAALNKNEVFDFVICNTPYAPVINEKQLPSKLEEIGNSVLLELLPDLVSHLSQNGRGILASWRAIGRQTSTYQMEFVASKLESAGCSTSAFIDLAPDNAESVLRILQTDLEQRARLEPVQAANITRSVRNLLQSSTDKIEGFYNQLIYFRKGAVESTNTRRAVCGLAAPVQVGAAS